MLLIKNGKVLTMGPQGVLEQADVLIGDDGKIVKVAAAIEAEAGSGHRRPSGPDCHAGNCRCPLPYRRF